MQFLEVVRNTLVSKEIGFGIVSEHENFEGIICHANGFHVENDALIDDKNKELLCCWTKQENYVVPECVDRIACISNNGYVKTITVKQPIKLTTVDAFAFDMGLKEIDFQGGVTGITKDTFYLCNYPSKSRLNNLGFLVICSTSFSKAALENTMPSCL